MILIITLLGREGGFYYPQFIYAERNAFLLETEVKGRLAFPFTDIT